MLAFRRGHLVYAEGDAEPYLHVVRRGGIEIRQHALDLTLPPAELLAAVEKLVESTIGHGADHERAPADPP
ncbi:hypothetical protein N5079_30460 [Planotetraspora sp. A-T 1434]|uniref:hypothetical protein n=1 Tax=Planotetraspora sp. A-T 1434 TaxID=2979219 RepID=UPI0021C18A20|nr:hypothetical protein [Planotetraspora sp. A-T 1434]MCT9934537.1 hypothetical protein [Planotetraspora sp. A-T 1434]